jgi:hypothetical protein
VRTDEVIRRHIQGNLSDGSVFSGDMTSGTSTPVHDDKTPREDYLRWSNGVGGVPTLVDQGPSVEVLDLVYRGHYAWFERKFLPI